MVYQPVLSVMDSNGWYISLFCLSQTLFVGISPCVVYHEQKWLVYHPVLSVLDKTDCTPVPEGVSVNMRGPEKFVP